MSNVEGLPIIWLLFLIISGVVSAVSKNKKAQQKNAQNPQDQRQGAQPVRPAQRQTYPPRPVMPARPAPRQPAAPAAQPHAAKPLEAHIHSPAPIMGIEGMGTEGEDCCHEYMLNGPVVEEIETIATDTEKFVNAQALLQGVIYSEILGRRAPARCGRRRA